ncbi:MAG: isoprenyl transferase [Patescibacteria group bacterium]|nr:MAG: isoprenyl transferase [Patescibacteria group bacterium]
MNLKHLAIIPDGNRRWARSKGLPEVLGHNYAAEKTLPRLLKKARELKIKYFTFWAMSSENLVNRPEFELNNLFKLLEKMLEAKRQDLIKNKTCFKTIGDIKKLPETIQKKLNDIKTATKDFSDYYFTLAINYGGRDEIVRAVNRFLSETKGEQTLTKELMPQYLDTAGMPDPDLIIRTGKEKRVSGFMLWQSEYSEYFFSDKYFPEFAPQDLESAVKDFLNRQRRFGK